MFIISLRKGSKLVDITIIVTSIFTKYGLCLQGTTTFSIPEGGTNSSFHIHGGQYMLILLSVFVILIH